LWAIQRTHELLSLFRILLNHSLEVFETDALFGIFAEEPIGLG
jgi:hypothetical protein